jgi:hypothetical protein
LVLLKNNTLKVLNNTSFASKNVDLLRRFLFKEERFRNYLIDHFLVGNKDEKNEKKSEEQVISNEILPIGKKFSFFIETNFFFSLKVFNLPDKVEKEWILLDFLIENEIFDETEAKFNSESIPPKPPVFYFTKKVINKKAS